MYEFSLLALETYRYQGSLRPVDTGWSSSCCNDKVTVITQSLTGPCEQYRNLTQAYDEYQYQNVHFNPIGVCGQTKAYETAVSSSSQRRRRYKHIKYSWNSDGYYCWVKNFDVPKITVKILLTFDGETGKDRQLLKRERTPLLTPNDYIIAITK